MTGESNITRYLRKALAVKNRGKNKQRKLRENERDRVREHERERESQDWEQNKTLKYIHNMLRQVRDVAAMKQEQDIIKIVISAQG